MFCTPIQAILIVALLFGPQAGARPARAAEPEAPPRLSKEELVALVAPIALYPDELLAIVLPGSTYPIQIVQASRYLEKRKSDPELKPSEDWDPSVLGLLNYPEVMAKLNDDLDWTWRLGDAVVNQQPEVMAAVQEFRAQVDLAGNLKSDDKMAVEKTVEDGKQVIVIESTSTEVIYVPTYQPSTVVVYSTAPYYYSPPYPYYYNPAATVWTGMFVGAAIAYGVGWGPHGGYGYYGGGNININNNVNNNINIDNSNNANIDRDRNNGASGGNTKPWKPDDGPGSASGARPGGGTRPGAGTRPTAGTRPSTVPGTGAGSRPGAGPDPGGATRPGASTRPAGETSRPAQAGTKPSLSDRSAQGKKYTYSSSGSRSSSVGDYQSGSQARQDSSRGTSSRSGSYGGSRGGGGGGGGRGRR
jgi:hypothetical protein